MNKTNPTTPSALEAERQYFHELIGWYHQLTELSPQERETHYRQIPDGMAQEVREMFDNEAAANDIFESPPIAQIAGLIIADEVPKMPEKGQKLGDYTIIDKLGSGGFGEVYKVQTGGKLKLEKAAKVLRRQWNDHTLARFKDEGRTLAALNHTNIVSVESTNITENGLPYLIMPYIKGTPITTYCREHLPTITQRLQLFQTLCDALQHAHQRGIIHRDLKPSNILVTCPDKRPVPHIIDFGIAAEAKSEDSPPETGLISGTPPYMSPEQTKGHLPDTRADIYSLGVVLYEMLTDIPFFGGDNQLSSIEKMKQVREREPIKPSRRIRAVAGSDLTSLDRREAAKINYELDAVILKAVAKDAETRYHSVSELQTDLQRFMNNRTVTAVKGGMRYDIRKFIRRHKVPTIAIALAAASLVMGLFVTIQAKKNSDAANKLLTDIMTMTSPEYMGGQVRLVDALMAVEPRFDVTLGDHPEVRMKLRRLMAETLIDLGKYDQARLQYQKLLLLEQHYNPEHTPVTLSQMAVTCFRQKQFNQAENLLNEALAKAKTNHNLSAADRLKIETVLGHLRKLQNNHSQAAIIFSRIMQEQIKRQHNPREIMQTRVALADTLVFLKRYDQAEMLYNEAFDLFKQKRAAHDMNGFDRMEELFAKKSYANLQYNINQGDRAVKILRRVLVDRSRILGEKHPKVLLTKKDLALMLNHMGVPEEPIQLMKEVYHQYKERYSAKDPRTIDAQLDLAYIYKNNGQLNSALQHVRAAYESNQTKHSPATLDRIEVGMADLYYRMKQYPLALGVINHMLQRTEGRITDKLLHAICTRGEVELAQSKPDKAMSTFEQGLASAGSIHSDMIPVFRGFMVRCHLQLNEPARAQADFIKMKAEIETYPGNESFIQLITKEYHKFEKKHRTQKSTVHAYISPPKIMLK